MSSLAASQPTLAVSGEVGVLAEENAQRLASIFIEAAMSCLFNMRDVVEQNLRSGGKLTPTSFQQRYAVCLQSLRQWSADMLQDEMARIEAAYPETRKLHQFVVVSVLSEAAYADKLAALHIPPVAETYHCFLKRMAASPDVQRGLSFFELTLCQRRVVFLEAFRNAFHDVAWRCVSASPPISVAAAARRPPAPPAAHGAASSATSTCSGSEAPAKSRLEQAMQAARAPSQGSRGAAAHEPAAPRPPSSEVDAPAPAVPKDSKAVVLLDSPPPAPPDEDAAEAEAAAEPRP